MRVLCIVFLLTSITALGPRSHAAVTYLPDSDFRKPLQKCWQSADSGRDLRLIASDNEAVYLLASPDNVLERWNLVDGGKDWELALPASPIHIAPFGDRRLVAFINGASVGMIQTIGSVDGLIVWQRSLPSKFLPESLIISRAENAAGAKDVLYEIAFIAEDGILRKLDPATGIVSEFGRGLDGSANRLIWVGDSLLFPWYGRWKIFAFDSEASPVFGSYQGEILSMTAISDLRFAAGDSKGGISLYKVGRDNPVWRVRTGGAVTELMRVTDSLVAASRDNYLYSFNLLFGTLQWKRRFEGRLLPISVSNHFAAVAAFDSNNVDVIDLKNGKKVNGISDDAGENRFRQFSLSGSFLSVLTERGLQVFSPKCNLPNEKADR